MARMKKRIEDLDPNLKAQSATPEKEARWISAWDKRIARRGLMWQNENANRFYRLPLRAESVVRDVVWELAKCSSGAHLAFRTDTTSLAVRVETADTGHMPHMAMTGSNGLFLLEGAPGQMRPRMCVVPDMENARYERTLFENLAPVTREFRLYLPLYKELLSLELQFSVGAKILAPTPTALPKPVVYYGTSIAQGGCASTAASDFVSLLGRKLNLEMINLGFSGNGKGEKEVANLISEIDSSLVVLDYSANVSPQELRKTLAPFVKILRTARPDVPIVLVTDVCYSRLACEDEGRAYVEARRDTMIEFYASQRKRGDRNIHLADGFGFIPFAQESAFVDGVHPTDHGFYLMATGLAPIIERILFSQ